MRKGPAILLNIGFRNSFTSQYREAFRTFNSALQIFRRLNDKEGIAHGYYNLGLVYLRMGDFETSMDVQMKSYKLRLQLNSKKPASPLQSANGVFAKVNWPR